MNQLRVLTMALIGALSFSTNAAPFEIGSGKTYAAYICQPTYSNGLRWKYARIQPVDLDNVLVELFIQSGNTAVKLTSMTVPLIETVGSYRLYSNNASDSSLTVLLSQLGGAGAPTFAATYVDKKARYDFPEKGMLNCSLE